MIPIGSILENFILALRTPIGFFVSFSTILFVEIVTFKSIFNDAKEFKRYTTNRFSKKVEQILILKNKNKKFTDKLPAHIISE